MWKLFLVRRKKLIGPLIRLGERSAQERILAKKEAIARFAKFRSRVNQIHLGEEHLLGAREMKGQGNIKIKVRKKKGRRVWCKNVFDNGELKA